MANPTITDYTYTVRIFHKFRDERSVYHHHRGRIWNATHYVEGKEPVKEVVLQGDLERLVAAVSGLRAYLVDVESL